MTACLHQTVFGDGKPLVLLHGWAMHSAVWCDFAQILAQDARIICVDLPGHGLSQTVQPYDLDHVAAAVLDTIDEPVFSVLGWSLGATVAMAMIERAPERIQRLFVLAGNPHFIQSVDWPGVKPEILDRFADLLQTDTEQSLTRFLALQINGQPHGRRVLQALKQGVRQRPPPTQAVLQAGIDILKTSDLRDTVIRATLPMHWILGGRDALVPVEAGERLHRLKRSMTLDILPDASHAPFLSHTATLRPLISGRL
ncbi:MAG: pimeloyl-ACP methyl ester esterase BioH [Methylomonas sp.]|nr:pimeloyl-ACP methyl ester esterase BioH [Methylomonas sp.]PPD20810.1 MAG: pimeloyl-[acyl-carrier protein] methyl ester esterase [Methylomonas sp.]PPD27266.1 MAG: pimeloyl-[acyl-carrier protein] methyl ester esterase [Methylomonas sp.]PPD38266.1 MAG: pimeloyl-[acyl-carrier protein] methyl ester esterase [Methylomonas sp.]PPD39238.1 MAG: pimeloyl-[acyl-carrier protein] methyl ester esterase [Methylomonas sp.]